jgi:hypothetical protein
VSVRFAGLGRDHAASARNWGVRARGAGWLVGAALVAVAVMLAVSAPARAADCALPDFGYNATCGPEFESPAWGDSAGWTDPSKYSTIKLADITGNGTDDLIARNDDGLEIWRFDTSVGQWRPAIGANGLPEVLSDFHSPAPAADVRGSWKSAQAFSTIQTADLYGDGEQEIIADHEPSGTSVWRYTPPEGSKSISGGTWSLVSTTPNVLPTSPSPSQYLSLHAVGAGGGPAVITDQSSYWTFGGNGFHGTGKTTLAPSSSDPSDYLDNMSGLMPESQSSSTAPNLVPANVYRTPNGVGVQTFDGTNWVQLGPAPTAGNQCRSTPSSCSPFSDIGTGFNASPSSYETLQVANDLAGPNDPWGYVLGRLGDGLHVAALTPILSRPFGEEWQGDQVFPVLTALGNSSNGFVPPPAEWSSIRTGDVSGDGKTDVVAVVNGQLRAWELDEGASDQLVWHELPAQSTVNLGSTWQNNASYYSTIQVGPVAGPGSPDAVIARGPFGIRTWFYCPGGDSPVPGCADLQGKTGWTSWLPQDSGSYPQFTGGQAAAWTELNTRARHANLIGPAPTSTIRDAWTGPTAPTDGDLTNLENGLLVFAGCTGETSANPPTYSSCAVPAGSSGFSADDWTAVVNQALAEIYDAKQTIDFFAALQGLNSDTFLSQSAELPALSDSVAALGQAAGGNTTTVSTQAVLSAGFGIAGALAGIEFPPIGAALAVASYLAGIVPSASPELNTPPVLGTITKLQNDLASAVSNAPKVVESQSFEVRQNYGMLRLVAEMSGPGGPWSEVNAAGLRGSMEEGFALWAYKQLLPTVLDRYDISGCGTAPNVQCYWTGYNGAIGTPPDQDFTVLNSAHTTNIFYNAWPCWSNPPFADPPQGCNWDHPPTAEVNGQPGTDIATKLWGKVSDTCNFNGDPHTEWTFGCNLGINPALSTDTVGGPANGWNFTTCTGQPSVIVDSGVSEGTCSDSTSAQATIGSSGSMTLTAAVGLPAGFHVSSATVSASRLLHEPGGPASLLTRSSGGSLGTVRLTAAGGKLRGSPGGAQLGSPQGEPPMTLAMHHTSDGEPRLTLSMSRLAVGVPYACQQLPASVAPSAAPFTLQTSLQLSDGHMTQTVSLPAEWRCMRNRGGAVIGLRTVAPPSPAHRSGLALSVTGPQEVIPGSIATYTVRVRNTRPGLSNRDISSLWSIRVQSNLIPVAKGTNVELHVLRPVVSRLTELRHGKTKLLRIRLRVPSGLKQASIHRVCLYTGAIADSAHPASARVCSAVRTRFVDRGSVGQPN